MKKLLLTTILFTYPGLSQSFPFIQSITPAGGTGTSATFQIKTAYTSVPSNALYLWLRVGEIANGCDVLVQYQTTVVSILSNDGSTWGSGPTGGAGTQTNNQCNFANSSVSQSFFGNIATVNITLNFLPAFAGVKTIWAYAYSVDGTTSNWYSSGTWTIPGTLPPPTVQSVSPTSGSGLSQTFTVVANDPAGSADILYIWLKLGNGCNALFQPIGHVISLLSDDGSNWNITGNLGGAGTASNSSCNFAYNSTSATPSGNTIIGTVTVNFNPTYAGSQQIGAVVYGLNGVNSSWVYPGTWTVPTLSFSVTPIDTGAALCLGDDVTGNCVNNPTTVAPWIVGKRTVRLKSGQTITVPNFGDFELSTLKSSHDPIGNLFVYHYTIDTRKVWGFRIGDDQDTFWMGDPDLQTTHPKDWSNGVFAWYTDALSARVENAEFSVTSKYRPGPLTMYLVNDGPKTPVQLSTDTEDNMRIHSVLGIFDNSLKKLVIGPSIKPGITKAEFQELVGRWVNDYGLTFLQPLLDGKSLSDVSATDGFELIVLQCLRNVISEIK